MLRKIAFVFMHVESITLDLSVLSQCLVKSKDFLLLYCIYYDTVIGLLDGTLFDLKWARPDIPTLGSTQMGNG